MKNLKKIYIPPILERELHMITKRPLTVISGISGSGKTTAAAGYLARTCDMADLSWHTFLGEPPANAWKSVCALIAKADPKTGAKLRKIGTPTMETLSEITAAMHSMNCSRESIIVLDNYQLAGFAIPGLLLDALSLHQCGCLHMVIITQPMDGAELSTINPEIYHITGESLFFSEIDVGCLFAANRLSLTPEDRHAITEATGGWIAALCIQLEAYFLTGSYENCCITDLVEKVWRREVPEEYEAQILRLCIPDNVTPAQAAFLLGHEKLRDAEFERLKNYPFVRWDAAAGVFIFHSLLREFARKRLEAEGPRSLRDALSAAARSYFETRGDSITAARLYIQAEDYKSVFSLPLAQQRFIGALEYISSGDVTKLLDGTPHTELLKQPELLLVLLKEMSLKNDSELTARLTELVGESAAATGLYDEERRRRFCGELEFLKFYSAFNDVDAMCDAHRKAAALLNAPIRGFCTETWTFYTSSLVCMYWRESGKLAETCGKVAGGMPLYQKLTFDHGAGAGPAVEADRALLAGNTQLAAQLAERALICADRAKQYSICYCAWLTLARCALLDGSAADFRYCCDAARKINEDASAVYTSVTYDLWKAFIGAVSGEEYMMPEWITTNEIKPPAVALFRQTRPFACIAKAKWMLGADPKKLRKHVPGFIEEARGQHMLLPELYFMIFSAAERYGAGDMEQCEKKLAAALDTALPDDVLLPFAEAGDMLMAPLTDAEKKAREMRDSQRAAKIKKIIEMAERLKDVRAALGRSNAPDRSALTPRELQVALLLRHGLTTKNISNSLQLTDATVCTVKKRVYAKLAVHTKLELARAEF